jgi:hypothetical protein
MLSVIFSDALILTYFSKGFWTDFLFILFSSVKVHLNFTSKYLFYRLYWVVPWNVCCFISFFGDDIHPRPQESVWLDIYMNFSFHDALSLLDQQVSFCVTIYSLKFIQSLLYYWFHDILLIEAFLLLYFCSWLVENFCFFFWCHR